MTVALALVAMLVAVALVWRGHDVRVVLFVAALAIGAVAGQLGVVFRKTAETLADAKFLLPICSAMGFAYVVRQTGCVEALVRLLLRPIQRVPRLTVPGGAAVGLVVNAAIPSQTSTLAAVGPLLVALLAQLRTSATLAGTALVLGASSGGALLNPGLAEVAAVAAMAGIPAASVVVPLAPAVLASFAGGTLALLVGFRFGRRPDDDSVLTALADDAPVGAGGGEDAPSAWKAILPPLPIVWLLSSHPALPTGALVVRVMPAGLEVFTAMIAGSALTMAFASRDRAASARAMFVGMGYAFTHVITIIAVSAGTAKALEVAGVLRAFVGLTAGTPLATLAVAFVLAFALAFVSGSGTASSVALVGAFGAHVAELGVTPMALGGVVLLGAEAGRTTSPVAAVLLFGSTLVSVPPRTLATRLLLPCFLAALAGAVVCVLRFR